MANASGTRNLSNQPAPKHYFRTAVAALFGIIAVLLVLVSLVAVWLNQTLTNTQLFVDTLSPLATQPDVQNLLADKAAGQIIESAPTADLAQHFLKPAQLTGKSDTAIRAQLMAIITQDFLQIMQKPAFASLWRTTLTNVHSGFVAQMNSDATSYTINLKPTVDALISQLKGTDLQILGDKLAPSDGEGMDVVIGGDLLPKLRHYYTLFQEATLGVVAVTLLAALACVMISVHHLKTLRRILVGVGLVSLFVVLVTFSGPALVPAMKDPDMQKAAVAAAHAVFRNLQLASLAVGVVCLTGAIGSKVYTMMKKA